MSQAGLSDLERLALQSAREDGTTSRRLAARAHVTRAGAGAALRRLERAGFLQAELIGGGELGYRARRFPAHAPAAGQGGSFGR